GRRRAERTAARSAASIGAAAAPVGRATRANPASGERKGYRGHLHAESNQGRRSVRAAGRRQDPERNKGASASTSLDLRDPGAQALHLSQAQGRGLACGPDDGQSSRYVSAAKPIGALALGP